MRLKLVPIDLDGSRSFPSISEIGYLFSVIELDRIVVSNKISRNSALKIAVNA